MASYYEKYFEDNKIALACGDLDETAIKIMKLEYHERLGTKLGVEKRWNRQFVKDMIKKIKRQTNTHSARCPFQPLNYYEVENENGQNFLLRTSYYTPTARKKVIPWEDSFEFIWDLHKNSHTNVEGMIELIQTNNICLIKQTAEVIFEVCYVCRTKNKPNVLTSLYLLDIKEMVPRYDSNLDYKHILVYDDLRTRFIHLIPVSVDVVNDSECVELSLELFKIFMDFGAPLYIEVYEQLPFFRVVLNSVENAMGVPNKIALCLKEQADQRVRVMHVYSEVKEWLLHNVLGDSVRMCYALQWKFNNTIFRDGDKTPYEIVFDGQNQIL